MALDKEQLINPTRRPPLEQQEIPVQDGVVVVRALSRAECHGLQGDWAVDEVERRILNMAMLDPPMTTGEVRLWQECSPAGEIKNVVDAVEKMSGLARSSERDAVQQFPRPPE